MEKMEIKGERRTALGTRPSRKLREMGRLPAVIYGHGEKPETITLDRHEIEVGLAHGLRTLKVNVEGNNWVSEAHGIHGYEFGQQASFYFDASRCLYYDADEQLIDTRA